MSDLALTAPSAFTYGDHTIDFAGLPTTTIEALLRRGVTHYLGNEQASKVVAWAKAQEVAPSDEAKAARKAELVAAAVAAMADGTIGTRPPSTAKPRVTDPVESIVRKLAKAAVVALLAKNGFAVPKGDATVKTGSGEFTMDELIARNVTKNGEAYRVEAKKLVAAEARAKAKLAEGGVAEGEEF